MASVVALIPARAGSKGLQNKNVRMLSGRPLLAWTIAASRSAARVDRVIVSTDSPDYAALSIAEGAEAPFLRPAAISGDHSTDYEFIVHALDWLAARGEEPDYLVHMRPTTPLRDPSLVDAAIQAFLNAPQATALRSVHEMSESAYKTFEIAPGGRLKRIGSNSTALDAANKPRQQYPRTYCANGYVDVLSTAFIRKTGMIHGDWVIPFITPPVADVDTEDDFAYLEFQIVRAPYALQRLFA